MSLHGYGNDTLRFAMEFISAQRAYFWVEARLYKNATSLLFIDYQVWSQTIDQDVSTVALFDFSGYSIRKLGYDGPYLVQLSLTKSNQTGDYQIYNQEMVHTTKDYSAQSFPDSPITVDQVTFHFIDSDNNSKIEWIKADISLTTTVPENYRISAGLVATYSGKNEYTTQFKSLSLGTNELSIRFCGWLFSELSLSQNFTLRLWLYYNSHPSYQVYDNHSVAVSTQKYNGSI